MAKEVSLKQYVDARFNSTDRATDTALGNLKDRLDQVNEFRAQLTDQAGTFLPREEYRVQHTALTERVEKLESWRSRAAGAGAIAISIVAVLGGLVGHAFK